MSDTTSPSGTRLARRLIHLYVGLALYGASSALLVRAGLGLEPWGVLHQGLAERTGISIGVVSIIVGAVVLLLWIPIRQRPGLGTVSNVFAVGIAMDGTLALVPDVHGLVAQVPLMAAGIVLNGVATGLYISARFGPGPRDGLMTGLNRLTGRSIRLVRTAIEVAVVVTGFLLGGSLGSRHGPLRPGHRPARPVLPALLRPPGAGLPHRGRCRADTGWGDTSAVTAVTSGRHPYLDHPSTIPFAHRGGAADGLENTATAFRRAAGLGYRYFETDVHATADGRLVAFHDPTLDRVTDSRGRIAALPWSEVRRARVAGSEPLPLFEELLEEFPGARWNVDIKAELPPRSSS